ncbi:MAG: hypothetical protein LUC16_00075 [Coprobacillus sp.]|nr:hypothetical protein [Coprobacillus sp.]
METRKTKYASYRSSLLNSSNDVLKPQETPETTSTIDINSTLPIDQVMKDNLPVQKDNRFRNRIIFVSVSGGIIIVIIVLLIILGVVLF